MIFYRNIVKDRISVLNYLKKKNKYLLTTFSSRTTKNILMINNMIYRKEHEKLIDIKF